ncbi:RNase H domain-containing protein [Trichonephila clavipes]|nr:RNase H domain-containing protein [Trichonephila clavipes]
MPNGNKMSDHPELLKQLALEVIAGIPLDAAKIYTDGSKGETNTTGSGVLIELPGRVIKFQKRNADHASVFRTEWVPSHVDLGNEVAGDLAKAATSNPVDPENHMVLKSTEIYSKAKELIFRTWVVPPVHPWYFQRHPGSPISFKGSRSYQTAFSRLSTGNLRCMNFEGGKRSF